MELYFFSYWQIPENKKTLHYSCLLLSTYFLKILCYSFWIPQILCYKILLDLGFFHIDILYNVQYILPMHHCKVKSFIHGRNINLTDSRYAIKFDVCNIYFPLEKIEPLYLFHHAISTLKSHMLLTIVEYGHKMNWSFSWGGLLRVFSGVFLMSE